MKLKSILMIVAISCNVNAQKNRVASSDEQLNRLRELSWSRTVERNSDGSITVEVPVFINNLTGYGEASDPNGVCNNLGFRSARQGSVRMATLDYHQTCSYNHILPLPGCVQRRITPEVHYVVVNSSGRVTSRVDRQNARGVFRIIGSITCHNE